MNTVLCSTLCRVGAGIQADIKWMLVHGIRAKTDSQKMTARNITGVSNRME